MLRLILGIFLISMPAMAVEEWLPPARYDHPYKGRTVVLNRTCPGAPDSLACAWVEGSTCKVALAPSLRGERRRVNMRHEVAHCNGWPGHHPGARSVNVN